MYFLPASDYQYVLLCAYNNGLGLLSASLIASDFLFRGNRYSFMEVLGALAYLFVLSQYE